MENIRIETPLSVQVPEDEEVTQEQEIEIDELVSKVLSTMNEKDARIKELERQLDDVKDKLMDLITR